MKIPTEQQLHELYRAEFLKNGLGEPDMTSGTNRAVVGFVLGALQIMAQQYALLERRAMREPFSTTVADVVRSSSTEFFFLHRYTKGFTEIWWYGGSDEVEMQHMCEPYRTVGWSFRYNHVSFDQFKAELIKPENRPSWSFP